MKKCYCFPTWEEQKDVYISCDEKSILFINAVKTNIYALTQIIDDNEDSPIIAKKIARDGLETMAIDQSTPSDPILAKLCELTGAKMYGDYIVFNVLQQRMNGDVLRGDGVYRMIDFADQQAIDYEDTVVSIGLQCEIGSYNLPYEIYEYCFNAFEEYSKFLRGEENKWEELKKLVEYSKFLRGEENKWEELKKLVL